MANLPFRIAAIALVMPQPGQLYPLMFLMRHRLRPCSRFSSRAKARKRVKPVIQVIENIARESLVFLNQLVAVRIAEGSGDDLNQVYQSPNSTTTGGQKLDNADNGMSGVESVDPEGSHKEAKQKSSKPVLAFALDNGCVLIDLNAAGWADYSFGIDFFSTICAVHVFLL